VLIKIGEGICDIVVMTKKADVEGSRIPIPASPQPSLMGLSSNSIAEDSDDPNALFFFGEWMTYPYRRQGLAPYPYARKPIAAFKGRDCSGLGCGFCKNPGYSDAYAGMNPINLQYRPRNLATAVQVSIDTAVQHCEVWKLVAGVWYRTNVWSLVRWALVVGMLVGIRARLFSQAGGRVHVRTCANHRRRRGVLVIAMVKPTWLGSASICEG